MTTFGKTQPLPNLGYGLKEWNPTSPYPVHVYEGDDALITCVVRDVANNTVVWKHEELEPRRWKVLTAGHDRVTVDQRFQVLHDEGKLEL